MQSSGMWEDVQYFIIKIAVYSDYCQPPNTSSTMVFDTCIKRQKLKLVFLALQKSWQSYLLSGAPNQAVLDIDILNDRVEKQGDESERRWLREVLIIAKH